MGTYGYAGLVNLGSIPITDCERARERAIARERVDGQQSESRRMRKWASICRWSAVIPITVGSKTASHPVMLSEETNFDCVLGRSWMEKMGIK
jgi:hypothetical protein